MSTEPEQNHGAMLLKGMLAAPLVIPFLPIILPLVLLYYFGQILTILARPVRRRKGRPG